MNNRPKLPEYFGNRTVVVLIKRGDECSVKGPRMGVDGMSDATGQNNVDVNKLRKPLIQIKVKHKSLLLAYALLAQMGIHWHWLLSKCLKVEIV